MRMIKGSKQSIAEQEVIRGTPYSFVYKGPIYPLFLNKGPTSQILKQCAVFSSKVCTSAIAIFLVTAKCRISPTPSDEH